MSLFLSESFDHYWSMWNETDLDLVRGHLEKAVSEDFIFCDPINFHVGREALEQNVRELRTSRPTIEFALGSGVDSHHNRSRYVWHLVDHGKVLVKGFDVATINDDGHIERIDGFFGSLPES